MIKGTVDIYVDAYNIFEYKYDLEECVKNEIDYHLYEGDFEELLNDDDFELPDNVDIDRLMKAIEIRKDTLQWCGYEDDCLVYSVGFNLYENLL